MTPKLQFLKENIIYIFLILLGLCVIFVFVVKIYKLEQVPKTPFYPENISTSPTIPGTRPSATPTVKALSLAEMSAKFGPCAQINVLMYHHIQSEDAAKKDGQASLSVDPKFFREQLQYLKDKNYSVIAPQNIIDFFDENIALPKKPVLITLDDAYKDSFTNAFPILREFSYLAVIFTPTGLVDNPDYLTWDEISQMKSLLYFANHTWSHHSSSGSLDTLEKEISLADTQLSDHALNQNKIFAYPYGNPSLTAETVLSSLGYKLAFTTTHGNFLCKGQRFFLPRIRIGNAPLNKYGL